MGDLGVQRGARLRLAVQGQILPGEVILVLNGRGGGIKFCNPNKFRYIC